MALGQKCVWSYARRNWGHRWSHRKHSTCSCGKPEAGGGQTGCGRAGSTSHSSATQSPPSPCDSWDAGKVGFVGMLASVGSRIANQVLLAAVDPGRAISPDSRLRMLGRGAAHASSSSGLGSALAELPLQETPQQLIMRKLYQDIGLAGGRDAGCDVQVWEIDAGAPRLASLRIAQGSAADLPREDYQAADGIAPDTVDIKLPCEVAAETAQLEGGHYPCHLQQALVTEDAAPLEEIKAVTGPLVEAEECPQLTHHGFTKLEPNAPPSEAPRCIQHDGALPSSSSCALVVPERLVSTFSVPRTLRAVSMEGGDQPGLPAKSSWSLQRETRQSWMETVPRGSCSKDPSPQTEQGVGNALLIPEPLMSPFEVSMQNGPDTHWHASPVSSSSPKAQPTSQQKAEQLGIPSNMSQSPCSPAPSLLAESLLVPTLRDSEIRVKQKLGAGSFGSVFLMKPIDEVGFTAVKVIRGLSRGDNGRPLPESVWQGFEREWEACRSLRHRNIVRFEKVFWYLPEEEIGHDAFRKGQHSLCIEMEFCSLGSLEKLMRTAREVAMAEEGAGSPTSMYNKHARRLAHGLDTRLSIARQVAAGLDHMHSKGLIHRDLRPTNIVLDLGLIDTPDDISIHGIVAKVCDFGASRHVNKGSFAEDDEVISPKYQAPEVLLRNEFGPKSDVFSFGVLLWELVTMQEAWGGYSDAYVLLNVPIYPGGARPEWPTAEETGFFCHSALRALVERCWLHDPDKRPTLKQLLAELKIISFQEMQHIRSEKRAAASLAQRLHHCSQPQDLEQAAPAADCIRPPAPVALGAAAHAASKARAQVLGATGPGAPTNPAAASGQTHNALCSVSV